MLTLEDKIQFSSLAAQLSPENLSCDGELRGRALQTKAARLRKEWKDLERKVGRTVDEGETYSWYKEIERYHRQELEQRMAAQPQHALLRHSNEHVWSREGGLPYEGAKHGQSAYYIQNFGGPTKPYILYSEFAQRLLRKEKLGEYPTLDAAVEAGEAFLLTVTKSAYQRHTQYTEENIYRELTRLPDNLRGQALLT